MNLSKFKRKANALLPAIALAALLIATMTYASTLPPATVHSEPDWDQNCYCHSGDVAIVQVNGTDSSNFTANVQPGQTFTLRITVQFYQVYTLPDDVAWMSNMTDNAKFKFDPTDITDNSPQDQDPTPGIITGLFRITAPSVSGTYDIALSYRGHVSIIPVNVGKGVSQSYAAITKVDFPLGAKVGHQVRMNITLQNNATMPSVFYVYSTNGSSRQTIFGKVYTAAPVAANGTVVLTGSFEMPNNTVTLTLRSGHVQSNGDVDDDRFTVSILQSLSLPPVQRASFGVLAMQWAPWVAIIGASVGSVPLVGMYARKGKRLFPKAEKLKLAIVDCAICGGCEISIADLGENLLNLMPQKIDLVYAPILMSAREYGPVDVVFVVGAVRNEEDLKTVKQAREKAKILVAFGTCPAFGGLNNLANLYQKEELLETAYVNVVSMEHDGKKVVPSEKVPRLLNELKPLSDYVKVDLTIPGCPPPTQIISDAVGALLHGMRSGGENA